MTAAAWIVAIAAFAVFDVALILVLHKDYEDGLVGRIALAMMGVAGLARVLDLAFAEGRLLVSPVGLLLWCGLALFLGRHLYRFLRWRHTGMHDWRSARDTTSCGKRAA